LAGALSVVDHRPAYAYASRFPGAEVRLADAGALRASVDIERCHAAVVMSHHLQSDACYLRELAEAGAPAYVGLLGPAARRSRLARELGATADMLRTRIRGPVGLDIGAATPEGIALAIVGEIHAWLAGRAPDGAWHSIHRAPPGRCHRMCVRSDSHAMTFTDPSASVIVNCTLQYGNVLCCPRSLPQLQRAAHAGASVLRPLRPESRRK
jgi:hypothetical protein